MIVAATLPASSPACPATTSSPIAVMPAWVDSVDAVYHLFEDPRLSNQYPSLAAKVKDGVRLCEEVITELGLKQCALSFNGGKDCTVIVHMLAAVLRRLAGLSQPPSTSSTAVPSSHDPLVSLPSVYITCPSPFEILESFIRASQVRYNLDLVTVPGEMKEGLVEYFDGGGEAGVPPLELRKVGEGRERKRVVEGRKKRGIKAIFIGTRRTDPMGDTLTPRKWTDPSWPKVERIHPILDWEYSDVWAFLRCPALGSPHAATQNGLSSQWSKGRDKRIGEQDEENGYGTAGGGEEGVPYCSLYEQGFTSLGSTFNTFPNPLLKRQSKGDGKDEGDCDMEDAEAFRPAWQLTDGTSERAGREIKKPLSKESG